MSLNTISLFALVLAIGIVVDDAIVVDNTGIWKDSAGLSQHLDCPGVAKVVLTAPAKGSDIKNIVFGVNSDDVVDAALRREADQPSVGARTPG